VDFAFSEDQQHLRAAVRRLLADRLPAARLHEVADGPGTDPALWTELAALGWVGLSAPDGGGTFLDEAVLLEEAGYALAPVPLLSTTAALPALVAAGADPTRPAAVAWGEPGGPEAFGDPARIACTATGPAQWRLTGTKSDVVDLGPAERVVVVARPAAQAGTDHGPAASPPAAVLLVDPGSAGVHVDVLDTIDGTRRVGHLDLADAPAQLVAGAETAPALLTAMRRRALAGLALESVGIAQRALEISTTQASTREQFGRVIGTYQAVSHRVADVYVAAELARSLAYRAAWYVATAETEPGEVDPAVVDSACSAAKAAATQAGVDACESLIQVLGGIGMTWEHPAHRFYKRALANHGYAGTPAVHRAAVAAALLDA
jgi:alkylation response protein AidB-like acyl-CoA dehydrogenase